MLIVIRAQSETALKSFWGRFGLWPIRFSAGKSVTWVEFQRGAKMSEFVIGD